MNRKGQAGQVLVLFAGGMVALLALCALAIDLSQVFSLQGMERSVADAAALAGAQDLQTPGSHGVNATDATNARTHALSNLVSKLGGSGTATTAALGSNCNPSTNIVECAVKGTPFQVSIKTPSPSVIHVSASRAVQVTVRQADVPLNFAHLFGQHDWNVAEISVAGLDTSSQYAVITLRPPTAADRTGNEGDITINGTGSAVVALNGDIGMNTGAVLNGNTATVSVSDGYLVRYYGATTDTSTPPGPTFYQQAPRLTQDPKYPVPVQGSTGPGGLDTGTCTGGGGAIAKAAANGYDTTTQTTVNCYKPGVYSTDPVIGAHELAILEPGVYFFNGGLTVKGSLIGGYEPASPGVALVIPQSQNFTVNATAPVIALDRGSAYDLRSGGQEATAAMFNGVAVETNTTPAVLMSVIVPGTPSCTVTIPAPSCGAQTINWTGAGGHTIVSVGGVVYAPSDNSNVAGNSDPKGYFGQMVAWTITYSGGSTLNQQYLGGVTNGVLRLDAACSGGTSPCTP